jgi:hypothetical protein
MSIYRGRIAVVGEVETKGIEPSTPALQMCGLMPSLVDSAAHGDLAGVCGVLDGCRRMAFAVIVDVITTVDDR